MDKQPFVPRYRQIYQDLKKKISAGEYAPGTQLPFERVLCEQYGVERITIRRALELLVQDDLIEKRAGLGSFVKGAAEKRAAGSGTVLFIMMNSSNDIRHNVSAFNASLFFSVEEACREHSFTLLYVGLQPDDDVSQLIAEYDPSGILLISTLPDVAIQAAIASRLPTICINHRDEHLMSIVPDNYAGVGMAIDYLAQLGHTRIGYIDGLRRSTNATERRAGYRKALFENGLTTCPELITEGSWTYDGGREAMDALLRANQGDKRPTAVFAASDMMAIGAMDEIRRQGMNVPEDISVIGFDNVDMGRFCSPKLTTIGTDMRVMADIAMDHLTHLMTKGVSDYDNYTIRLPVSFVARDSAQHRAGR